MRSGIRRGASAAVIDQHPGYVPMYTVGGKWNREGERWTHWCDGFYPGIFWLLHKVTGETYWRQQAEKYTVPLAGRRFDRDVHDLGFLFFSTYSRWYRLTGDATHRQILIDAGRTLALRRQRGRLPGVVSRARVAIHRHHDERRHYLLGRPCDGRRDVAAKSRWSIAGPRKSISFVRTAARAHEGIFDTRPANSCAKHATGISARQHLVTRVGMGDLWLHGGASAQRQPRVFGNGSAMRRLLFAARTASLVPPWDFDAPTDENPSRPPPHKLRFNPTIAPPRPSRRAAFSI